jgi:hypothetical protein
VRACTCGVAVLLAVAALAGDVAAEPDWSYRARVSFEAQGGRTNRSSPLVQPGAGTWDASNVFVAAADSTWVSGRWKLAGGLVAAGSSDTNVSLQAREAYARISATSWMDVEAGKRLVRWGVGYGFAPTGVLDPPRLATDPTDRLGRHEGMPLVRADLFRGETSITIGVASPTLWRDGAPADAPSRLLAARVRTVLPGGVEVALIGSAAPGRRMSVGGNVTHVVGQRLEWHADLLVHDTPGGQLGNGFRAVTGDVTAPTLEPRDSSVARDVSAVVGFQYTLPAVNVVMEYHRQKTGASPGAPLGNLLFLRAARAGADVRLAPELIVIRSIDDGAWTTVAGLAWTVRRRVDVYARATHLAGPRTSRNGMAPVSVMLLLGSTVRF